MVKHKRGFSYKKIINTNITELKILENIYSKLDAKQKYERKGLETRPRGSRHICK
jgi:hypothetical protein